MTLAGFPPPPSFKSIGFLSGKEEPRGNLAQLRLWLEPQKRGRLMGRALLAVGLPQGTKPLSFPQSKGREPCHRKRQERQDGCTWRIYECLWQSPE